jgi:uncharacterized protein (TIGR02145 family)
MKKILALAFLLTCYEAGTVYAQQFGGYLKSATPRILNCNPENLETVVVEVTSPITSKKWMDRNLGASRKALSSGDDLAFGDLYQWGRGRDGHQCRDSRTRSGSISIDRPGHDRFILETITADDWRNPQNNSLWQGLGGINNPCPAGFRIPTKPEYQAELIDTGAEAFSSFLKLPYAGWRNNTNGAISLIAESTSYGFLWTSTVSSSPSANDAEAFAYYSTRAFLNPYARARGHSVRCIKN